MCFNFYQLKTPVYLSDEGPSGAPWLFLLAVLGAFLFWLSIKMENSENSFLSAFGEVFIRKMGIGLFLTGLLSGIISLT